MRWHGQETGGCSSLSMANNTLSAHAYLRRIWCGGLLIAVLVFGEFTSFAASPKSEKDTTKVVSLVPSFTEIAYGLGSESMIAGVSDFCRFPAAALAKPRVGGFLNPSLERIVALSPTVVVLSSSQVDLQRKLEQLSISTVSIKTDSLADVFATLHRAGDIFGKPEQAATIAEKWRKQLAAFREEWTSTSKVRALVVVSRQPNALQDIYVAGPASYLGELLEIAGGKNVVSNSNRPYPPVTKEQILEFDPEVIFDFSLGELAKNRDASEVHLAVWQSLSTVQAVKSRRIYAITDPHFTIPGPSMFETLAVLANCLHSAGATRDK